MDKKFNQELDELYLRYGYDVREIQSTKIYLFTKSIYSGADIINPVNQEVIDDLKKQYNELGYAVRVRNFKNLDEAEDTLFQDFFKADGVIQNLKRRYENFINKLMVNLPEKAQYEYIRSSYDYTEYKFNQERLKTESISANDKSNALVNKISEKINNHNGPLLIVIEAAAGYGKTCTAYEILNNFISLSSNKLPFFTELSRDRKASVFRHILAYEIEEQFSNRVDSNVVIHQIKKGKIPLIIDGFDELITKDFSFSSDQFEQVEGMLSTIIDLLTDNAKIVITSRKTAIFNSEEFHNWMLDRNINCTLARITISEPSIENWLSSERLEIVEKQNLPVKQIANPVLLTYLRYIPIEEFEQFEDDENSIVERYFNFLLTREQTRQGLLIEPDTQMRIFRKLVRFLTEWDIKAEEKEFIKELILEYNTKILEETKKKYTPDKRPRTDQLADILSNHAFLDRKDKNKIGFINEFVLGTLIGENLILGKYQEYHDDFYKLISQMFALLAVQAFQVQPKKNQERLWEIFCDNNFPYDKQFFFQIDLDFKNEIVHNYNQAIITEFEVNNMSFTKEEQFNSTVFTSCVFTNCIFQFEAFRKSSFVNCRFFNCILEDSVAGYSDVYFTLFGCSDNNRFIEKVFETEETQEKTSINLEREILEMYFQKGTLRPRHRQLSHIKTSLSELNSKALGKALHKLEVNNLVQINGDLSFITKEGISYYSDNYYNS